MSPISSIAKAADSFCDVMNKLAKDLPSIDSASATARAIDRWTEANEAYTNVYEAFLTEHEHYPKDGPSSGNSELLAAKKKINSIREDHPTLIHGLEPTQAFSH